MLSPPPVCECCKDEVCHQLGAVWVGLVPVAGARLGCWHTNLWCQTGVGKGLSPATGSGPVCASQKTASGELGRVRWGQGSVLAVSSEQQSWAAREEVRDLSACSYVRPSSVTSGCCLRQHLFCGSLCSWLCQCVCLWDAHSASLLFQPTNVHWPGIETSGSLGAQDWAPTSRNEELLCEELLGSSEVTYRP